MINIDQLILDATKNGLTVKRDTYRLIKAKFLEYKTSRDAVKKPFNDDIELNLLRKMKKELEEDIEIYKTTKLELAEEYSHQLEVVKELLPAEISEDDILKCVDEYIAENGAITQKQFGVVMKYVSAKYPSADKSIISKVIKTKV